MRRACTALLLLGVSVGAHGKAGRDWLNEANNALEGVTAENTDPVSAPSDNQCVGTSPTGRISLLGVESLPGPSNRAGVTPAARLGPMHPAQLAMRPLALQMGLVFEDSEKASGEEKRRIEASNGKAQQLKGLHDFYADIISLRNVDDRTENSEYMQRAAKAYDEYRALARQYATLHLAAEAAGRACP